MNTAPNGDDPDGPPNRLFLERRGYIQRRVIDGAKLLPIIGLVLFMVPLIWPRRGDSDAVITSSSSIYIFMIWLGLIVFGAFLANRITASGAVQDSKSQMNAASDTTGKSGQD
ncbi:hypothetical protein [Planktotalea sp.]|uniref:hypothetical protein n=1 Tax=Planktotalea sp. TaxID=2029877 RepID=UPI003297F3FF